MKLLACFKIITYPVSVVHSEKITVPSAAALTGVPSLATTSIAKCLFSELNNWETFPLTGAKNTIFNLSCDSSDKGKRSLLSIFSLKIESCLVASSVLSSI